LAKQAAHRCPGWGKGSVGGFAEEFHGTGAEPPEGLQVYRAERIPRACVFRVVVPALVSVLTGCSVVRGASCGTKVRSGERIHERDIGEYMAGDRAQVAMEVPECLGALQGAGS
jgi:hypothetical protein